MAQAQSIEQPKAPAEPAAPESSPEEEAAATEALAEDEDAEAEPAAPQPAPPQSRTRILPVESVKTRFGGGTLRGGPQRPARRHPLRAARLRREALAPALVAKVARNRRRELSATSINAIGLGIFLAGFLQPLVAKTTDAESALRLAFCAMFLIALHLWARHVLGDLED